MSTDAASHPDDAGLCHQIMDAQQATITGLQQRVQQLEHYIEQLLPGRYGPRSERVDPHQLQLFDAAATTAEAATRAETDRVDAVVIRELRRRGAAGRNKPPEHLPRETIEHDLPEEQKCCPESAAAADRLREQRAVEFAPAVLKVIEHVR